MVFEITSLDDERVSMFSRLTEAQLRMELEPDKGLFIAESPKVIRVALDAGWEPTALLCEHKHVTGDATDIVERLGDDVPVYVGSRELLAQLTVEAVTDTTNIGAIFRSAAALGIDAVLLTRDTCDPLNRRAVRVSMGTVFLVPWTWLDGPVSSLHDYGFRTAAMALNDDSVALDDERLKAEPHLALVMGTEGDGLPYRTIEEADYVVRIPMSHNVDSLNVAAATAVACWELRSR